MIATLLAFLGTKVGKYAVVIVVLLLTAGVVTAHFHAKWKAEGEAQVKVQDAEKQKTDLLAANEKTKQDLASQQKNLDDAKAQAQQATALATQYAGMAKTLADALVGLQSQRASGQAAVASVPDSGLASDIQQRINARQPTDHTPGFTVTELRLIDDAVTDYPLVLKENTNMTGQLTELRNEIDALNKRIGADEAGSGALIAQRDTALAAFNRVMASYTEIYNEFPRSRSLGQKVCHVASLGLACKPKHMKFPAPAELSKAATGNSK